MAVSYPIESKDIDNGVSKNNTIFVDTAPEWVPGIAVVMARQTDVIGGDVRMSQFRYVVAVSAKVSGLLGGSDLVGLGMVEVFPIAAKCELVAEVSFPPRVLKTLGPEVSLLGYEFCFTSDKETRILRAKAWFVPLYDVAENVPLGIRNVQTRFAETGDAFRVRK